MKVVAERFPSERLKTVADIRPSGVDKNMIDGETGVRLCNYVDVYRNDLITSQIPFMQASATLSEIERFTLQAGDVLITKDSETPDDIAVAALVHASAGGIVCGYHLALLRPKAAIAGEYLFWVLKAAETLKQFSSRAQGITRFGLTTSGIGEVLVPCPSHRHQAAIASFLSRETSKIEALVAEQERLIALLQEKRQAVISHAVTKGLDSNLPMKDTGVKWLGDVPAHWEVRTISSITTKITNGYVGPTRDILVDEGVRYLQSLHIKNNRITFNSPYFVNPAWSSQHSKSILAIGDVLVVQTGDIGQVAVINEDFAGCNCHALIILTPLGSSVAGTWLSWVLNSEFGRHSLLSIQTGALHPHLNCGDVRDVCIPLPPIVEQMRIVQEIENSLVAFDLLVENAHRAIALLRERRAALISAAVTGKIDVRDYASNAQAAAA